MKLPFGGLARGTVVAPLEQIASASPNYDEHFDGILAAEQGHEKATRILGLLATMKTNGHDFGVVRRLVPQHEFYEAIEKTEPLVTMSQDQDSKWYFSPAKDSLTHLVATDCPNKARIGWIMALRHVQTWAMSTSVSKKFAANRAPEVA